MTLRLLLLSSGSLETQESDEAAGVAEVDAGGEVAEAAGVLRGHLHVALVEGERDLGGRDGRDSTHLPFQGSADQIMNINQIWTQTVTSE